MTHDDESDGDGVAPAALQRGALALRGIDARGDAAARTRLTGGGHASTFVIFSAIRYYFSHALLFQPFVIISQPKTTRRRQTSSRRSKGEAKLLGVPASPRQAVAAEGPQSLGDSVGQPGAAGPTPRGRTALPCGSPGHLLLGLLPCHQLRGQHLRRHGWLAESGRGY